MKKTLIQSTVLLLITIIVTATQIGKEIPLFDFWFPFFLFVIMGFIDMPVYHPDRDDIGRFILLFPMQLLSCLLPGLLIGAKLGDLTVPALTYYLWNNAMVFGYIGGWVTRMSFDFIWQVVQLLFKDMLLKKEAD